MKLLLVDGSALLHRAYHAYPPLTTKTGEIVGAVYGVVSMLIAALETEQPTHVMVAWDLPKPTFRHEMYVGYKAQRPKAEEEMVLQIPKVKDLINAMGVMQIEQEGYEADDVIGTLSVRSGQCAVGSEIVILTGDQDTMQLVTDKVKVLTPPKGKEPAKLYGVEEVKAKYGVWPNQIVDYKAIVGDSSDNIPGVTGIGPTGAAKLLQEFGSLEEIYNNLEKIGEKQRVKLIEGKESAMLSQKLSRIVTEMEINTEIENMKYGGLQGLALKEKLEELGFKSLVRRIRGEVGVPRAANRKQLTNQLGLF